VFVAYRGETLDGYQFIADAIENGASAIICERAYDSNLPVLIVEKGVQALVQIAEAVRADYKGRVFAVTGSAGKSSTKEMITTLLGPNSLCSPASFNNLVGLSRTMYLVEDKTEHLILEMGMNALGEIRELCQRFRPEGGLITNIGEAHIGMLGGLDKVYQAKRELFEGIRDGKSQVGIVLNEDDAKVKRAYEETFGNVSLQTLTFSVDPSSSANVKVTERQVDPKSGHLILSLKVFEKSFSAELPIFGLHHAQNLAAAIATAVLFGIPIEKIQKRVSEITAATHRGKIYQLEGQKTLIDETYNSNPSALHSALKSLAEMDPNRRKVIILGDMLELGDFSTDMHRKVGELLAEFYVAKKMNFVLVGVGTLVEDIIQGAKKKASKIETHLVDTPKNAISLLQRLVQPNDLIFIKSSRGGQLDKLLSDYFLS